MPIIDGEMPVGGSREFLFVIEDEDDSCVIDIKKNLKLQASSYVCY